MPLAPYACTNCGHWQRYFALPPDCPVCSDVRNDLPDDGWNWKTPATLAPELAWHWREVAPGIHEFWTTPRFGLDSHGWLLIHPEGNVAFEAAPLYNEAALAEITRLGGIRFLAASHPHGYGALWQLQDRCEPEELLIQRQDLQWTKAFRVTLPYDDRWEIRPGLTLHHTGGHYEGHAVLHDSVRGALFAGDALKIDFAADGSPDGISCHKAYHKQIPLSQAELRRYRDVIGALTFDSVFTPFEYASGVTTEMAVALFDKQLSGALSTRPMPIHR